MAQLIHELIDDSAWQTPSGLALRYADDEFDYQSLARAVRQTAQGLLALGLERLDRVAVFLEKREEAVLAMFGAAAAGCVFVPVNPLLKPDQVLHILRDSGARVLVTSAARLPALEPALAHCPDLRHVIHTGEAAGMAGLHTAPWHAWQDGAGTATPHRCIENDLAALLYTSCASGRPKGVALSHRNLVAGAASVTRYLGNNRHDRILAALPLSLDFGLAQATSAFASGATLVLMNQLLTRDIPDMVERERITGLAAVPSLWIQLAALDWRGRHPLRYLCSSGGALPLPALAALRERMPRTAICLMHGSAEAFHSTCLAPEEVAARPDSIGKAAPNAEVLVLAPDGRRCAANEPGELVQRGPLVALGYWNDAPRSAASFRQLAAGGGLALAETALWTGDIVRMDEEGYLYLVGRQDDTIHTAGYRVSPTELEEVAYATGLVEEVAAVGVPHPVLGQAIAMVAQARAGVDLGAPVLLAACRAKLPAYMLPAMAEVRASLPRSATGAIDRRRLAQELAGLFMDAAA
jgi:acyl-CoA ligase (AMP-forming) (exosortase A-associated)